MKKRNKMFTKLLCIALVCVMLVTSMGAYRVDVKGSLDETSVYWTGEDMNQIFGDGSKSTYSASSIMNAYHSLELDDIDDSTSKFANYIFSINQNQTNYPVTVTGVVDVINFDSGISAYVGNLEGTTTINDVNYDVIVTVNKEFKGSGLFASVTFNAEDVDNTTGSKFMAIGTPFITSEMVESLNVDQDSSGNERALANTSITPPVIVNEYQTIVDNINSNGIFYSALGVNFQYNNLKNCALVNAYTNCAGVKEDYAETWGFADVSVAEMKIGLKSSHVVGGHVEGIANKPWSDSAESNNKATATASELVDFVFLIVSNIEAIPGLAVDVGKEFIEAVIGSSKADIFIRDYKNDSYVEYDFGGVYSNMPNFDEYPLSYDAYLDIAYSNYEDFSAYASATYRVIVFPPTTPGHPIIPPMYFWPKTGKVALVDSPVYIAGSKLPSH